ncbi:hypothetical protein N0V83_005483 [Neocucurbitaria cava]|uniref:Uncharacterized protein n=1 Tax=Neocucurbitaria cava TaxID=798079 RepID=A0A9W8Y756_9PLEO|nr:hypothetical protein N0V83_005483 [Neocucurbitaria cava]
MEFVGVTDGSGSINIWQSVGTLVTRAQAGFNNYAVWLPEDLFAWSHVYNKPERKIQLQLFTGADATNKTEDQHTFGQFTNVQCDISFKKQMFQVRVNQTGKLVRSELVTTPLSGWPTYGDKVVMTVDNWFNTLTFADDCISGCDLGIALVININQFFNQTGEKSNETLLRGTQDHFASLVDNILINLYITRLVSGAPDPTEEVIASVTVPALVFGDKKFIWIVGALNLVIVCAYLCELIRTRAWAATPPLDIMNDSEVMIAAFQGGRLFEKTLKDEAHHSTAARRISENTMLSLQLEELASKQPILTPHFGVGGMDPGPDEEVLLGDISVPSLESIPLAELRGR